MRPWDSSRSWASGNPLVSGLAAIPIIGTTLPHDAIKLLDADPDTHAIVMIGEIGGNAEDKTAAAYIGSQREKARGGFYRGADRAARTPHGSCGRQYFRWIGRRLPDKIRAMENAGITVCSSPAQIGENIEKRLQNK